MNKALVEELKHLLRKFALKRKLDFILNFRFISHHLTHRNPA
jgi:hypothetical protein